MRIVSWRVIFINGFGSFYSDYQQALLFCWRHQQKIFYHLGCLNKHETHVTANNSTNNSIVFFLVSDLKIVYFNNY